MYLASETSRSPCHLFRENYQYGFKGARSAPGAILRVIPREATWLAGEAAAGMLGGAGANSRGTLAATGWQLRLCTWRRTAGCRPCVTPGTARPTLAAVTPPSVPAREWPSSWRSSLEPSQDHRPGRSGLRPPRRTRWRCAPPWTVIFVGT
jgi:hypothetical protein